VIIKTEIWKKNKMFAPNLKHSFSGIWWPDV